MQSSLKATVGELHRKLAQPSVPPQGKQPPSRGIKLIQLHPLPYCRSFFAQRGTRVKKVPRSFIYSPFLGRSSLCASCFVIPPPLPVPSRSFFFHPRRLCNLPTFFTLSFFFFFVDSQALLGQLFLSLSFFRFLTTLARDLTDPIDDEASCSSKDDDESGNRLIKVRIGSIN